MCRPSFLDPRATWADAEAYDRQAKQLAAMFGSNFAAYADGVGDEIRAAGPVVDPDTQFPDLESDHGAG